MIGEHSPDLNRDRQRVIMKVLRFNDMAAFRKQPTLVLYPLSYYV